MVARVLTVMRSEHEAVTLNQKLDREPPPAPLWLQTRQRSPPRNETSRAVQYCVDDRRPRARVEQGAQSRLDAELEVESFLRIGHDRKRQIRFVFLQFFGRGVKNHDLPHPSRFDLGVPKSQLVKVPVTDRAAREATQLQVDPLSRVRNAHRITKHRDELSWLEHGTHALSRTRRWSWRSQSHECEQQQLPGCKGRRNYLRHAG